MCPRWRGKISYSKLKVKGQTRQSGFGCWRKTLNCLTGDNTSTWFATCSCHPAGFSVWCFYLASSGSREGRRLIRRGQSMLTGCTSTCPPESQSNPVGLLSTGLVEMGALVLSGLYLRHLSNESSPSQPGLHHQRLAGFVWRQHRAG